MPENHARACIPHYAADLLSHYGLVAMDMAFSTGWFVFLKRAFFQALRSIF
jgi:hypothetical protein